jgi:enamine deaminase RidA (YjgF/YER057c/UK114 family)
MNQRLEISSGAVWEDIVGYVRAVRVGDVVEVSGTTAVDEDGQVVGRGDLFAQTQFILQKIERALQTAGADRTDIVRTRMYLVDIDRWQEAARAHRQFFTAVRPAATAVEVSRLIGPDLLVEIEATAIITEAGR